MGKLYGTYPSSYTYPGDYCWPGDWRVLVERLDASSPSLSALESVAALAEFAISASLQAFSSMPAFALTYSGEYGAGIYGAGEYGTGDDVVDYGIFVTDAEIAAFLVSTSLDTFDVSEPALT